MRTQEVKGLIDQATDKLISDLEAGKSERLRVYLAAMGRFHRYSMGNAVLIWLQQPAATHVAGYQTWRRLGRQVRKGEKAISILAPIVRRSARNGDEEEAEDIVAFKPAHVFDVSQTGGRPLPEFASVRGDPGVFPQRLGEFAVSRGIGIEYARLSGALHGMSLGGRIVIDRDLAPAEQFSTMIHEVAHELLHRDQGTGQATRTVRETEAEAVAYIVSQAVGLDCNTAACDYIKLYDGNKETLLASLERIRQAAREIIAAILRQDDSVASQPEATTGDMPTVAAA